VLQDLEGTPRLVIAEGDLTIGNGLEIMLGPGHTDLCFPGHDAGMLLNYPKVAEDITRLA
jgi:hypothetical protein